MSMMTQDFGKTAVYPMYLELFTKELTTYRQNQEFC